MLFVFLLKPFKQWSFAKLQFTSWAKFFHKTNVIFQWKQFKIKYFLNFCFASPDSLKAVTACFEKFEVSAERFGLRKNDLN